MSPKFEFKKQPISGDLPVNYLPAALPYLQGENEENRLLITLKDGKVKVDVIKASDFRNPIPNLAILSGETGNAAIRFIGPVTVGENVSQRGAIETKYLKGDGDPHAIAIVDTGISFWNSELAGQFEQIEFIGDKQERPKCRPHQGVLGRNALELLTQTARKPGGEGELFGQLAKQFPDSIYANGLRPEGFSHGTAMADLAGKNKNPLFGIELPAKALHDRSGDTLQSVLVTAVQAAIDGFLSWPGAQKADFKLNIVLAYGFTGGPHDGQHPAVLELEKVLTAEQNKKVDVKLFLPIGNALQEKICAQIEKSTSVETAPLAWDIPPDDYSSNTIEMTCHSEKPPKISIAMPSGEKASVIPKKGTVYLLVHDEKPIGALLLRKHVTGCVWITRLTLAPTKEQKGFGAAAPYGRWRFGVNMGEKHVTDIQAWILRDDHPESKIGTSPHRQSHFFDPKYVEKDIGGSWILDARKDSGCSVKRAGTASVLSTIEACYAEVIHADSELYPGPPRPAWYSALPEDSVRPQKAEYREVIEASWDAPGVEVLGNGSLQRFRISGTSAAAAIKARRKR